MEISLNKILITGAFGYLGSRLSKYFTKCGYNVTGLSRSVPSNYESMDPIMEEIIIGDIRDESILKIFKNKNFDYVIHLISLDHYKSEDDVNYVNSINVMPIWNLLEEFKSSGLKKFIYFSTFQVYGDVEPLEIRENNILCPKNNYALTHLLSENICNYYNNKMDTSCINIRLSNGYGSPVFNENNCWNLVVNDMCKMAYNDNKIKLLSDGTPQRDFIHVEDICKGVEKLINSNSNFDINTFNLSSGITLSMLELAHMVKQVYETRYKKNISIIFPDGSKSDNLDNYREPKKYIINNNRINKFGFHVNVSLKEGINELFQYLE